MALIADIAETWRRPATVVRRHLDRGRSEPFLFTFLFVFLLMALVAQWPAAARTAALDPDVPVQPQMLGAAYGLILSIPVWYLLAALGRLAARGMGGRGSWYGARLALFWALVAVTPLVLLTGIVAGMIGPGPQLTITGAVTGLAFLGLWIICLRETERGETEWT